MKIGILTYHAVCNFGANLQAYSTLNYLRNRGYDVVFINWVTEEMEAIYKKKTPPAQFEEHARFCETYLPMTRRCYTDEDIASVIKEEKIDAVVVGSDAVMQTHPVRSRYKFPSRQFITRTYPPKDIICPNPFWGSFYHLLDKKIPLCFMSASSQNSPYTSSNREEKELSKKLLNQFAYISTRDDWTANQVRWLTDDEIIPDVTPDPVFAFNYNVIEQPTKEEICKKFGLNGRYCLFSFHYNNIVSRKWLEEIQNKMNKRGVQCVAFPFPQGIGFRHPFDKQIDLPLSPLDWYALIKNADYYIGENMHPIVICLHNAVPCFSFDHYGIVKFNLFVNEKSSKIRHILNHFGVLDNRISVQGRYREPSVDYVLKRIDGFDKMKVKKNAEEYQESYIKMMGCIEKVINKSE